MYLVTLLQSVVVHLLQLGPGVQILRDWFGRCDGVVPLLRLISCSVLLRVPSTSCWERLMSAASWRVTSSSLIDWRPRDAVFGGR
jgi:hypothetical protein